MKELLLCTFTVLLSCVLSQNNRYLDRRQRICVYQDRRYRHGEIVTLRESPCARFRCEYNNLRLLFQECVSRDGMCYGVGESWTESCTTFTCITKKINNKQHYRGRITDNKCPDSRGACHRPGSPFTFRIGSHEYRSCTCRITFEGGRQRMRYRC